jgi:cytochrome c oxidase subunit 1
MTTIDNPSLEIPGLDGDNYLNHSRGIRSWILTLDHKRIGVMYLVSVLSSFLLGGIFALLVRTQLLVPDGLIMNQDEYNQAFTIHGGVMVFLVIIPGIPAALGNFILPIMLGAKDVAFPRLNLFSYYLWVVGAIFLVMAIFGGLDTGWTFYTPYSIDQDSAMGGVIPAVTGAFLLGFASIFTGMNFIVTIHRLRPDGMTWFRMPLFLWAMYGTAVIQVLATPVLGITLALLAVERTFGVGIFNPALGGDPVLYQHFFWFYSHPAVYIMILPAMGVISDVIAVHSHRHIFGYAFIAWSSIAIAIFSFLVWGHHMFTSGQSPLMSVIFSFITFSVAIPSAVKVFNWLATMYKGSISWNTTMLYGMGFIALFMIGGLTGLYLGVISVDVHLHDTYFIVAHFHYTMMGSALIGFIAGLHHWWPKISGRMFNENAGRFAFVLFFIGYNMTFFTQFMLGSHGMPRRYATYPADAGFQTYHIVSTIGSYLMAIAFFTMAGYFIVSIFKGRKAPANPWGGRSLEWQCTSPPPFDNFSEQPAVGDCYDFSVLRWDEATHGYVWREDVEHPGHETEQTASA